MTQAADALKDVDPAGVERIEIVDVSFTNWDRLKADMPGEVLLELSGEAAIALVRQVAVLPDGAQLRCHFPTYGIRIHGSTGVMGEVALCFSCNNAATKIGGTPGWFTFDASSDEAQALHAELKRLSA
jgi:hypothetical protein